MPKSRTQSNSLIMDSTSSIKIFSGTSNLPLAQEICTYLGVPLGDAMVTAFPDNESFVRFNENIRGTDVFLVQSTSSPANHNVMELLIMISDMFIRKKILFLDQKFLIFAQKLFYVNLKLLL